MAVDCCSSLAKYLLCIFNFVFFVSICFLYVVNFVQPALVVFETQPPCSCPSNSSLLISLFSLIQLTGTFVLGIGVWLSIDKHSFISLLKAVVESEHIEVSDRLIQKKVFLSTALSIPN